MPHRRACTKPLCCCVVLRSCGILTKLCDSAAES
jgi:hypothetical protein